VIFLGFFIAIGWGLTFAVTKGSVEHVSPLLFVTLRFLIAAMALVPVIVWSQFRRSRTAVSGLNSLSLKSLFSGLMVGLLLFIGYWLQSIGLRSTSASQAGFIMGLAPVMVPFLAIIFLGVTVPVKAWMGVLLVIAGLPLLSLDSALVMSSGTFYCIASTFFFSFHVVLLQHLLKTIPPVTLTFLQIVSTGLVSLGAVAYLEPVSLSTVLEILRDPSLLFSLLFCGIGATAIATLVQCYLQQNLSIVKCALIFSTEPVFAAIFGYILLDEHMSVLQLFGAALVFLGVLEAELGVIVSIRLFSCGQRALK
jgi:drug/metabolite transporter (DMT)-like permease